MSGQSRKKKTTAAVAPGPAGDARRSAPLWMPIVVVAMGIVSYASAIDLPFVFDDHTAILENTNVRQLWPLGVALGAPVQSAIAGRPVIALSLALNYAIGGLSPSVFHAWNLGVLLLSGLVLFGIVRRTLALPRLADRFGSAANGIGCACALLWVVHPLQTEVVDYVTQRTESTMGLFYLLTLYSAIRAMTAREGRSLRWETASVVACVLGMASKESMVTAPLMVLAYDAVFCAGSFSNALRGRARLYLGLALAWVVLAVLIVPGPRSRSAGFASGVTPWTYLLNQPGMILTYLRLTIWPVAQVLDYGVPRPYALGDVWLAALAVSLLFVATIAAWRRRPELAFLGTWFFVTLGPSSSILPIATEVGAERRMFLPLAALVVAIVATAWRFFDRRLASGASEGRARWIPLTLLGVVCIALTTLTIRRNAEYETALGIWQSVLDRYPHGRAHYNLGIELKQQGRRSEAIDHYRLALPDAPEAHYALGFEALADGRHEEAIEHCQEFLRLKPDDFMAPLAYVVLGRSLEATGRLDEAAEAFRREIQMRPRDVDGRTGLASVLLSQQRFEQAVVVLLDLVQLDPGNAPAYGNLGIAYIGLDRAEDAVGAFRRAVELAPQDASFRRNLGNALAGVGRLDEAVAEYRRSIALAPGHADVHQLLATVLVAQGKPAEAITELRRAASLQPENPEIRAGLSDLVRRLGQEGAGQRP